MRIERLCIRNFGCLRDVELEFAPGLNVIRGPNEAGKSTLQAAIMAALFCQADTKDRSVLGRASWGAGEPYRLEMTLTARQRTWSIEKDFATRKARLACGDDVREGPRGVQVALREELGLGSEELFTSTAFVRQDELAAIGEGRAEIGELLQRRVTGGADDVAAENILRQLGDEIATMQRGVDRPAPKNPGPIARATARLQQAQDDLARAERELADLHGAQDALAEATDAEEKLNEQLGVEREVLARMEERRGVEEELANAAREYDGLDRRIHRAEKLQQEAEEAEAAAAELAHIAEKGPEALQRIDEVEHAAEGERGRARQLQAEIERLEQEAAAAPKPWPLVNAPTLAGLVLVVVGVVLGLRVTPWALAGAAIGAALLAYGVAKARMRPPMDYGARLGERRDELGEAEAAIRQAAGEIAATLANLGCETRDELAAQVQQAREHASTAQEKRTGLREALAGETIEGLVTKQREQWHRRESAHERLAAPELAAVSYSAEAYVQCKDTVRRLEAHLAAEQQRRAENAGIVRRASVEPEQVAALGEAVGAAKEQLANEQRRLRVYELVREVLAEAHEETLSRAAVLLGPRTGELLAEITRGRYDRVRVDETSLGIFVFSPRKGEEIPVQAGGGPQELSCATRAQVFLAARLALAELLWPSDPPPLLLDDPFVTFDPERRRAAAAMLQQLAERTQVMLFTCSGVYDHLGRVIGLAEPSEPRGHRDEDALLG
jgi:DNA repair exonuclease SbcCD ATPase subunit